MIISWPVGFWWAACVSLLFDELVFMPSGLAASLGRWWERRRNRAFMRLMEDATERCCPLRDLSARKHVSLFHFED